MTYKAMQMMETFHMCWISTTVLLLDFDLVGRKTRAFCFVRGYPCCMIVRAQGLPRRVDFRSSVQPEVVRLQ